MKRPRLSLGHPKSQHPESWTPRMPGLLAAVGWLLLWVGLWVEEIALNIWDALRGRGD